MAQPTQPTVDYGLAFTLARIADAAHANANRLHEVNEGELVASWREAAMADEFTDHIIASAKAMMAEAKVLRRRARLVREQRERDIMRSVRGS